MPLSNTTNLFNHLKQKHKITQRIIVIKKQKDKASATTCKTPTQTWLSIKAILYNETPYLDRTAAIGCLLAKDIKPVSKG